MNAVRLTHNAEPPSWLRHVDSSNDGYLLLHDGLAAVPVRHGRGVACLIDPARRAAPPNG